MRRSVNLNAPSHLPALFGARPQGDSLLALLAGRSGEVPATIPAVAEPDLSFTGASRQHVPVDPEAPARRDIAQFRQALSVANTPAQLLANPVALRVLLTSHGLADQAENSALATRVLLSNSARANSLLNQLKDPRWLAVNNLYSFATQGLAMLRDPETVASISRCYVEALRVTRLTRALPEPFDTPESPDRATPRRTG